MNLCKTCRWWDRDEADFDGSNIRECNKAALFTQPKEGDDSRWEYVRDSFGTLDISNGCGPDYTPPFLTGPDFGCNKWEAT